MAQQGQTQGNTKTKVRMPRQYLVIMHNDDITTMEFVVEMLQLVFHKKEKDAVRLMYTVHRRGSAVVGTYPYDLAMTKAREGMSMARARGFPFRLTVEAE